MKRAQIIIAGIAVTAGAAAYMLAGSSEPPATPQPVVVEKKIASNDVLVMSADVPMGGNVGEPEMRWQPWPQEAMSAGMIQRTAEPNAVAELAGSMARVNFLAGEPVRKEKLIRANGSGFMAAVLPSGYRAVAISIDTRGANTAGGFILPNDRVDVVRTARDEGQGSEVFRSETILRNVRVLAIGTMPQEKAGDKTIAGETATLELDPGQVEVITLAQKVGQLSLALRSLADANKPEDATQRSDGLTVVRFGVARQSAK